jgi:hypothetical protein
MRTRTTFPPASLKIAEVNAIEDRASRIRAAQILIALASGVAETHPLRAIAFCSISEQGFITGVIPT